MCKHLKMAKKRFLKNLENSKIFKNFFYLCVYGNYLYSTQLNIRIYFLSLCVWVIWWNGRRHLKWRLFISICIGIISFFHVELSSTWFYLYMYGNYRVNWVDPNLSSILSLYVWELSSVSIILTLPLYFISICMGIILKNSYSMMCRKKIIFFSILLLGII